MFNDHLLYWGGLMRRKEPAGGTMHWNASVQGTCDLGRNRQKRLRRKETALRRRELQRQGLRVARRSARQVVP